MTFYECNNTKISCIQLYNNSFPNDKTEYCHIIQIVGKSSSALSFIGSLLMLAAMILLQEYKNFTRRLVMYMTIAALMSSISYYTSFPAVIEPECTYKGIIMTCLDWILILWTTCLVVNLFANSIFWCETQKYEWLYISICFGLPILVIGLPSFSPNVQDFYGPATPWCWIHEFYWQMGFWYIPSGIVIIGMFSMHFYVLHHLRRVEAWPGLYKNNLETARFVAVDIKPLRFFPFFYLLLNVISISARIYSALNPCAQPKFVLHLMVAVAFPFIGAFNAIVYFCDRLTRNLLKNLFIKKNVGLATITN